MSSALRQDMSGNVSNGDGLTAACSMLTHAFCVSCNYPLRGLESACCPECGHMFDPNDPGTMNLGRPMPPFAMALLKPTGKWARIWMWSAIAVALVGPAGFVPSDNASIIWLLLWAVFMFACWLRAALRRFIVWKYWQPKEKLRVDDKFRRAARSACIVVALLLVAPLPLRPAVVLSRPWLDGLAY